MEKGKGREGRGGRREAEGGGDLVSRTVRKRIRKMLIDDVWPSQAYTCTNTLVYMHIHVVARVCACTHTNTHQQKLPKNEK